MPADDRGVDRAWHAMIGQFTGGIAPAAVTEAFFDWAMHLALSPDKQRELAAQAVVWAWQNLAHAWACVLGGSSDACRCALPQDDRAGRCRPWGAATASSPRSTLRRGATFS